MFLPGSWCRVRAPHCLWLDPSAISGYNRLKPVMPHEPMVPAGAPAELRLDAKKENVIPLYPY